VRAHVSDERLFSVFVTLWVYLGAPPNRLDALTFAQMWCSYHVGGCCYVAGGGQALADAFVGVIEAHGGLVRLGCAVERIVTEAGRVVGVDTDRLGAFRAPVVISNAAGSTTLERLLDQPALATKDRWTMAEMPLSASAHEVYIGLEGDATALGLPDRLLFVVPNYDEEAQWAACERGDFAQQGHVIANHNLSDPGRAPPGCSILNAIVLANGRLWRDVSGEDAAYRRRKQVIEDHLLDLVARELPDVRARVEVCETGTPYTMARYSWNPDGVIYGVAATPDSHTYRRPSPRTQVAGLYLAGSWTFPSGGFVGAMISGLNTADRVREDLALRA
jgi:prolycopene isomerase